MKIETEQQSRTQKKTKSAKPLASALTVASPVEPKLETSRARSRKAPSTKASGLLAAASSPRAAQTVEVTFALHEPHAKRVALCGGFNAWSPEATPMNRAFNGHWATSLALPPGRYEYKFVVDGQWLPDPNAHEQAFNGFGTLNSVIEVRA
jgi:1,4-alpha-glucan branching enzyme